MTMPHEITEIRFVKRPSKRTPRLGRKRSPFYDALEATATNGKALVLPLNGDKQSVLDLRLRTAMAARGFKVAVRLNPDRKSISTWAVPR